MYGDVFIFEICIFKCVAENSVKCSQAKVRPEEN